MPGSRAEPLRTAAGVFPVLLHRAHGSRIPLKLIPSPGSRPPCSAHPAHRGLQGQLLFNAALSQHRTLAFKPAFLLAGSPFRPPCFCPERPLSPPTAYLQVFFSLILLKEGLSRPMFESCPCCAADLPLRPLRRLRCGPWKDCFNFFYSCKCFCRAPAPLCSASAEKTHPPTPSLEGASPPESPQGDFRVLRPQMAVVSAVPQTFHYGRFASSLRSVEGLL